ncbi:uncharacterized protein LOC135467252 [Liolophura sinensis]|uniref:uncharacterized protein LOC135467252 n=1 Tax=Liolophura sinensis TaxID=3198878 RepID=UPI0031586D5D
MMAANRKRGGREEDRMMTSGPSGESDSICSTDTIQSDKIVEPPDGGWGWVIVFAAFMCAFIIDGVTNSFGVFYVEFLDYFQADKAVTALAGSLICGCFLTFGMTDVQLAPDCTAQSMMIILSSFFAPTPSHLCLNPEQDRRRQIEQGVEKKVLFTMVRLNVEVCWLSADPGLTTFLSSSRHFLFTGAISSPLVSRFGCRSVAFVGGIVTSVSLVLCSFSPNIESFLFTYGCLAGVGLGLVYVPSMLIVNFYFDKKRGIASGIVTSGAGVGVVAMAKLSQCLLKEYGWKGAHMIIAGVALNLCVCACLFQPLRVKRRVLEAEEEWDAGVEEVVAMDTATGKLPTPILPVTPAWSPVPHPRSHVINNCVYNSRYMSLPMVEGENKSHYYSTFRSKPALIPYMATVRGTAASRSTEFVNHTKGSDTNPARPYTSMFTVSTTPSSEARSSSKQQTKMVTMSPLVRKDIFFSGSVMSLEQFKSQPDMKHYIASIMVEEEESSLSSNQGSKMVCGSNCSNFDLSFFKSMTFNIFCVSSMLIQIAGFIPAFYLGNYAQSLGLDASNVSTFLTCIGFSCIIGRLLSGALASWKPHQCLNIMAVSLTLTGVVCALYSVCKTVLHICVTSSLFGFLIGFFPPVQPMLLVRYLGLEKLSASFGLSTGLKGLATMVGPPLAGVLLESTGTYIAPFCFGGACLSIAGFLHWVVPFVDDRDGDCKLPMELDVVSCDSGSQTGESLVESEDEASGNTCQVKMHPSV